MTDPDILVGCSYCLESSVYCMKHIHNLKHTKFKNTAKYKCHKCLTKGVKIPNEIDSSQKSFHFVK